MVPICRGYGDHTDSPALLEIYIITGKEVGPIRYIRAYQPGLEGEVHAEGKQVTPAVDPDLVLNEDLEVLK